ncbi:GLUG motif-containing protein [uncultured Thioclava sp.]|uniref:GLUG motif-containing protein n=1 Tax=uncultured Thioclava sp. TaxID=473858 RepID=UPI0025F6710B|nr:GLUG motif-containing protein [uncultured Thioclava sp.]
MRTGSGLREAATGPGPNVGGLVGVNYLATINNAYATGAVSGTASDVGGLVGFNYYSTISNVYATGAVSGTNSVGGLVGSNYYSTISNVYATGAVSGTSSVGGLMGATSDGTITNGYWDTTTSGTTTGEGYGDGAGVSGLSTAELAASLPIGFDGAVWSTSDNRTTPWLLANRSFGTVSGSVILGSDSSATPQRYDVIANATQLQNITTTALDAAYVLAQSLDLSGISDFNPIGSDTTPFTGKFDGLGHTISNLTINRPSTNYVGLFSYTSGATISNVGLVGGSVSGHVNVGGLVGYNSGSTISNVYATGVVSGTGDDVGGLVGYNSRSTISNAYATGAVSGTTNVGGLVGDNSISTISNAYATGAVSGSRAVGGLVGMNASNSTISNAYATGVVSGPRSVGGLAGYNSRSTISDAYWDTTTSGLSTGLSSGSETGVTGLTTAELAGGLPSGFDGSVWSTSDNQSTPWLLANRSFGTVSGSVILGSDSSATPQRYDVIATTDQLQNINTTGLSGTYVLGNDLDLASIANFAPMGITRTHS